MIAVNKKTLLHIGLFRQRVDNTRLYIGKTRTKNYLEVTPFSRGGLWKIRFFTNHSDVYHGTQKQAYCTDFNSAVRFIKEKIV